MFGMDSDARASIIGMITLRNAATLSGGANLTWDPREVMIMSRRFAYEDIPADIKGDIQSVSTS